MLILTIKVILKYNSGRKVYHERLPKELLDLCIWCMVGMFLALLYTMSSKV